MNAISPEKLASMQGAWIQLISNFGVTPIDAYPVFDRLVAAHSEPHRHYHTLEHLAEMFKVAGRLINEDSDSQAIQLAIWFHDSVYDPRAKDNEGLSAALAQECLASLGIPSETRGKVEEMIRATAHSPLSNVDPETAILLDADLAILSAEERRYARYADEIRREYAWVDESAYRVGRTKVLQTFLDRARIYLTERMYSAAEAAARYNLHLEIERLK